MKRRLSALCLSAFLSIGAFGADALEAGFKNPPNAAKPHTWWHWINGYVSAEGITKDLEAMARAGIGGFQAFQIERHMDPGPVKYLSKEWRELMTHTIREADRLGLEVCYHQCAGWSSSGGPWITPEYAMQTVLWTETQVQGGNSIDIELPRPEKLRDNYFQDVAVIAFPTPESEQDGETGFRLENWKSKAGFERDNNITPDTRMVNSGDQVKLDSIIDLTDKMNADGQLRWKAPKGHWTIVRFGHGVGGNRNRPAPREGSGYECDKMSKAAAEWHWKHTVQKVLDDAGPLAGKTLNNVLIDSYETGQQNWTKGFDNDFKERMGYDLITHLPAVTGRVINNLDYTERFLWDYRRVIADMWTENYWGHFLEMCHDNGLLLSCEPYGKPGNMDDFAVADVVDIPMGEWWARNASGPFQSSSKLAASAAHTNGRRFVGAEAFTAGRMDAAFVQHPYRLKAQGDYFFCQGVNRFIFHTFVHQPWPDGVLPGMTMAVWGFQNNRNNTWYEQGRAWNEYLARSQYLLQEGTFQADLCYYPGESVPQTSVVREKMDPEPPVGYDYDTISKKNLMRLTVRDGRLILPGRMEYRLLVMPDGPVRPEVLKKVEQLLREGAHVVWKKPDGTPGLQNYPNADQWVKQAADQLWGDGDEGVAYKKGALYGPDSLAEILSSMGVLPDVEFHAAQEMATTLYTGNGYEWIHRKTGSADIYLISNQQEVSRRVEVVLRDQGRVPELWCARTGEIRVAPLYGSTEDGRTFVKLFLDPAESVFVVFKDEAADPTVVDLRHDGRSWAPADFKGIELEAREPGTYELIYSDGSRKSVNVNAVPEPMDLSSNWILKCPKGWGPEHTELEQLASWSEHSNPELKYFSGTAVYGKQFDVPVDRLGAEHAVTLDLGNVQIMAEVILNGKNLGILWKPPFRVDVSGLLKEKDNRLEVRVTNLWVNRLIGDEYYPTPDTYIAGKRPGEELIEKIPDWLKKGASRPATQRKTFVICKFYSQDSPLVESGLIGPVKLHFAVQKKVSE